MDVEDILAGQPVSSYTEFPEPDDYQGWVDVWCAEDTGNIDCVAPCLRGPIMDAVTPEGWLKVPCSLLATPLIRARWAHGRSHPRTPWFGQGSTPNVIKQAWHEALLDAHAKWEAAQRLSAECGQADLYFIRSGEDGPIKIGITGGPIHRRLKQLQTAHPFKLHLLHLEVGQAMMEIEYHERFAGHRLEGEWFEPHPDILAEVHRLTGAKLENMKG